MNAVKPGILTTEFLTTIASNFLIAGTTAVEAIVQTVPEDQLTLRLLLLAGVNGLYALSRAITKLGKNEKRQSPAEALRDSL